MPVSKYDRRSPGLNLMPDFIFEEVWAYSSELKTASEVYARTDDPGVFNPTTLHGEITYRVLPRKNIPWKLCCEPIEHQSVDGLYEDIKYYAQKHIEFPDS